MTRIGNVDQVLMLLQQQLRKLGAADRKPQTRRSGSVSQVDARSSVKRVASLSARDDVSEEQIERALIRALLVDELGEAMAEDHRFDRIANEVYRVICGDEKSRQLLHEALGQARNSA